MINSREAVLKALLSGILHNTGVGENPSLIQGLDKERTVQNVTFENVVINGERMKDLKGVVTNDFIKGIKIK